jgi:hypothetical protein
MSSTTGAEPGGHLIARFSSRLHVVLDGLGHTPAWSMTADEQRTVLVELTRAQARIGELRLRVLAAGNSADIAAQSGASSTAAWLAHATTGMGSVARAEVRLAAQLDTTCAATREALAAGRVSLGQAGVIVKAVNGLPAEAGAGVREVAEKHLIGLAADHDEKALTVLGRRVFEVVDPAAADAQEGRRLAAEETAAARSCYLHLFDNGNGTHTGRFKIPSLHAVMLRKILHAFLAPRHASATRAGATRAARRTGPHPSPGSQSARAQEDAEADTGTGPGEAEAGATRVSRPEQLGQGFCDLLERFPAQRLPRAGGVSASVVVLLDYEKLLSGLGSAQLDTGEQVSAGLARRLACEAGIIPVVYRRVLGGRPVVLDMGRRRRFHTASQRIAMGIEQGGCTADSCDRPAGWCDAHHDGLSWAEGAGTSVEHGRLLCPFHHGKAHSPSYRTERLPDGRVSFHRRT